MEERESVEIQNDKQPYRDAHSENIFMTNMIENSLQNVTQMFIMIDITKYQLIDIYHYMNTLYKPIMGHTGTCNSKY